MRRPRFSSLAGHPFRPESSAFDTSGMRMDPNLGHFGNEGAITPTRLVFCGESTQPELCMLWNFGARGLHFRVCSRQEAALLKEGFGEHSKWIALVGLSSIHSRSSVTVPINGGIKRITHTHTHARTHAHTASGKAVWLKARGLQWYQTSSQLGQ